MFEFYSDLRETIEAILAEEDRAAYRWTMAGTDPRRRAAFLARHFDESAGRREIVEEWYNSDQTDAEVQEVIEWLDARHGQPGAQ
jgi:hypothetical protein